MPFIRLLFVKKRGDAAFTWNVGSYIMKDLPIDFY